MKCGIPFLSFALIVLLNMSSVAGSISVSGSVSGVWDVDTVKVIGDIDVGMGDSLRIMPGVLVEFAGPYSFYIRGFIRAEANYSNQIVFDVADSSGFSNATIPEGGWNGIQFFYNNYTPDSSFFEYCTFRHGKAVSLDSLENHGGAMCLRRTERVRISNCLFQNNFASLNGGAIYLETSSIVLEGCDFEDNRCGPSVFPWGYGGAICSDASSPIIFDNYFFFNASSGAGGAVAIRFKDAMVNNNRFWMNYSGLGGAIAYLHYYEYPFTQCNNQMLENTADFFGGAIANLDAGPTFVNNTITLNSSAYGGAFYVKDSLVPNVYNSILWDNNAGVGPEVYLWDAFASANFYYCDIEGGFENFGGSGGVGYQGIYENNKNQDPEFFMPAFGVYRITPGSPCHNAGTPDTSGLQLPATCLDGGPRIDNFYHRIDMGSYELWLVDISEAKSIVHVPVKIFPNPTSSRINIHYLLSDVHRSEKQNASYSIGIYTIRGVKLMQTVLSLDQEQISEDVSAYPAGTYFVLLKRNDQLIGKSKFVVE